MDWMLWKTLFTEKAVKPEKIFQGSTEMTIPGNVQKYVDIVPGDMVSSGLGRTRLMVGLNNLKKSFPALIFL